MNSVRKLDKTRDVRLGFCDYVQCTTPNLIKHSMSPRTVGALPVGNLQGLITFFTLPTSKIIVREKWTVLPLPRQVIEFLNAIAKSTQKRDRLVPLFSISNAVVTDVNEPVRPTLYDSEPMRVISN